MIQTVEIYYSFDCPYSYLAIDRLSQIEHKFDIKVLWQPFSAKAAGQNFQAAQMSQDRASYIREDVKRLAKSMEMPLLIKDDWPEQNWDPEKSIRGALVAIDMDIILEYNIKMFNCWWAENSNPNDQSFFIELCDDLDVDPNEFAGKISTTDTREKVRGIYKRGRKLQVFTTPMIVIEEERFHGLDRIAEAEERLANMGAKKPAWL